MAPAKRPIPFGYVVVAFLCCLMIMNLLSVTQRKLYRYSVHESSFDAQRRHNMNIDITRGLDVSQLHLVNEDVMFLRRWWENKKHEHPGDDALRTRHSRRRARYLRSERAEIEQVPEGVDDNMDAHHVGEEDEEEHTPSLLGPLNELTIFVSVVSYRDKMCPTTLRSLFAQAMNPQAVRVGLVEQHGADDPPCVLLPGWIAAHHSTRGGHNDDDWQELAHPNVKVLHVPPWRSKGPAFARALAAQMFTHEAYFLMVDSHTLFTLHWDQRVILMHAELEWNSKAPRGTVITHHPPSWTRNTTSEDPSAAALLVPTEHDADELFDKDKHMILMCYGSYDFPEHGFPIFHAVTIPKEQQPAEQPFLGAGFVFTDGGAVRDVPFDTHLPFLFHGEEILYAARLWTSGFDLFSPNEVIVKHYYYRASHKRFNNDSDFSGDGGNKEGGDTTSLRERLEDQSIARVQYLLKSLEYLMPDARKNGAVPRRLADESNTPAVVREDAEWYGLGLERTLADYWAFSGLDPVERTLNWNQSCCRECVRARLGKREVL